MIRALVFFAVCLGLGYETMWIVSFSMGVVP